MTLTDWDPDGEVKVVAAALYAASACPMTSCSPWRGSSARRSAAGCWRPMSARGRTGATSPGRAFERTAYRFDVLGDYGAFRDLQRHRLLTLEWQPLSTRHGWVRRTRSPRRARSPDWTRVMDESAALHDALAGAGLAAVAPYAVAMAYRVRFYMEMNAREAMHMLELRTAPQGHPAYRRICQAMHRLIAEQAGHSALAAAMRHVDHSGAETGRLAAERAAERRRGKS